MIRTASPSSLTRVKPSREAMEQSDNSFLSLQHAETEEGADSPSPDSPSLTRRISAAISPPDTPPLSRSRSSYRRASMIKASFSASMKRLSTSPERPTGEALELESAEGGAGSPSFRRSLSFRRTTSIKATLSAGLSRFSPSPERVASIKRMMSPKSQPEEMELSDSSFSFLAQPAEEVARCSSPRSRLAYRRVSSVALMGADMNCAALSTSPTSPAPLFSYSRALPPPICSAREASPTAERLEDGFDHHPASSASTLTGDVHAGESSLWEVKPFRVNPTLLAVSPQPQP